MRNHSFRWCMLIGALALTGVAVYYFISYVGLAIALSNNALAPFYQNSMRALWITFGVQSLLLALLYFIVAFRPRAVTREVIVICGLLQLTESVLLFTLAGNAIAVALLGVAALCVLAGSLMWPRAVEAASPAQAQISSADASSTLPAPDFTTRDSPGASGRS